MTFRPSDSIGAATILARSAAAPAAAAPVPVYGGSHRVYGGHTAQDAPIALRVAGSGRALTQLLIHVRCAPCDDGNAATSSASRRSRPSPRP